MLANHRLAEKLQNCDSVAVTTVLREAFSEFRGKDKILKLLNNILFLPEVSATAGLGLPHPTPSWESTAALLTGLALRMCHTLVLGSAVQASLKYQKCDY